MTRSLPLVLNVDAASGSRDLKTRSLQGGEMEVLEADSGVTALEVIGRRRPALVLLDLELPGADGVEVCRRIKSEWPDIIVIQLSASAVRPTAQVPGLDSNADCYLRAPVEPVELIAVTRAMLRLRQAECQAQESSERYRMMVESAVDCATFTLGLDARITSWNCGAQAILGYLPDQIIGEPWSCIFIADDIAAGVPEAEMRAADSCASVRAERWHRRRDGTLFWSSGRMAALRDRRGDVAGYLKILHDHSIERQARDALEALNADLENRVAERTGDLVKANERVDTQLAERASDGEKIRQLQKMEALGQLTGGIAHDFNNLLTAILGGLEVTRRRTDDPRSLRLIDSSMSAAQRGAKLIAQLMAFARKQNLHVEYLPLNTLVREMQELLERSVGTAVRMVYDLAPDAWPVMADANQVQTALLNLAINARDAMPDGGTLRIASGNVRVGDAEADVAAGAYACLTVQDSGVGMSEETKARLFEPFFTTKEVGKGTGLGLAQVYGFVRQSGGTVRVASTLGQGTTITILLPRAAEPPAEAASVDACPASGAPPG
ncbi:ATP-binding response regulator [Rhodopila sp.]|uniref:ATP-binding response regulator n=1 Tax=Rhodopila sp. TaxID=2480087 RepID=UPI003D114AF8